MMVSHRLFLNIHNRIKIHLIIDCFFRKLSRCILYLNQVHIICYVDKSVTIFILP